MPLPFRRKVGAGPPEFPRTLRLEYQAEPTPGLTETNTEVSLCNRREGRESYELVSAEAMSRITLGGAGPEHRRAITFVGVDNEPSIRGCQAAGYEVYIGREETWRLGKRNVKWGHPQRQ